MYSGLKMIYIIPIEIATVRANSNLKYFLKMYRDFDRGGKLYNFINHLVKLNS